MTEILASKNLVATRLAEVAEGILVHKKRGITPKMRVFLVGANPASLVYIGHKERKAKSLGIDFELVQLNDDNASEAELEKRLEKAIIDTNHDDSIHGTFIQLPLPKSFSRQKFFNLIDPKKDLDCFHSLNIGKVYFGNNDLLAPCTPKGILTLLKDSKIEMHGKKITVIGRSHIVGRPMAMMLNNENATVNLCHRYTKNLSEHTKNADIIISAVGKPRFLTAEYFRDDQSQVLVDIGITKVDGKICGDMDYDNLIGKVKAITPVPGGVGPLTVLSLMENLVTLLNMD
ncbi:bifunctional 5,10-methylenetetrahydrofolate dehydrogenase/5,10-methenyltetrahydrofolate cyclohydrolase [Bacteriovoracaceae bacterium]|nr:bifunctional 5,10-methylenetetrahydrofolate dehydrogenase/5,10-methenyltetrahydrofolate cyclohydrolase [Bacteriovoracaceae bacterium]